MKSSFAHVRTVLRCKVCRFQHTLVLNSQVQLCQLMCYGWSWALLPVKVPVCWLVAMHNHYIRDHHHLYPHVCHLFSCHQHSCSKQLLLLNNTLSCSSLSSSYIFLQALELSIRIEALSRFQNLHIYDGWSMVQWTNFGKWKLTHEYIFCNPFFSPLTIPNPNITLIFGKILHHWPCPSTTLGN